MELNKENNIVRIFPFAHGNTTLFYEREAYEMVPLLLRIARQTKQKLNVHYAQLSFFKGQKSRCDKIQENINEEVAVWSEKMRKLGLTPISLLKVKIPGELKDYYWEFPSDRLDVF